MKCSRLLDGSVTQVPRFADDGSASKLTWRIALDHHFGENILGYISNNRGFKSGGFDLLSPSTPYLLKRSTRTRPESRRPCSIGGCA